VNLADVKLRPYQEEGVEVLFDAFMSKQDTIVSSPTGSGKTYIILELLNRLRAFNTRFEYYVVSPSVEILQGFCRKCSIAEDRKTMESVGLFTPIRLRNLLVKGEVKNPKVIIIDEVHHAEAATYKQLKAITGASFLGVTATPYRGRPAETKSLKENFKVVPVLDLVTADEKQYIQVPVMELLPIVDDDNINLEGPDFRDKDITDFMKNSGIDIRDTCNPEFNNKLTPLDILAQKIGEIFNLHKEYNEPVMVALPGVSAIEEIRPLLDKLGIPYSVITADTPAGERQQAFENCCNCESVLLQINVVSEGVDLPIRVLIDARPTVSPVRFMQTLGRITRVNEERPVYYCTNRNIERFFYLFKGLYPPSIVVESQEGFKQPSNRSSFRTLGLKPITRYKPFEVKLKAGGWAVCRNFWNIEENEKTEYFVIQLPGESEPLVFAAKHTYNSVTGQYSWGKWKTFEVPEAWEPVGYTSKEARTKSGAYITEKQLIWWNKSAEYYGLDPDQELDQKVFSCFTVLSNNKKRL